MEKFSSRPIILISNSSWYLFHYRKLLIKKIKRSTNHILALTPYDSTSVKLSNLLVHIPWRMSRVKDQNLYSFSVSFLRMILLIRALKPKLVHSHTLQANLITSIASSFFGINCVLSFAGVGRFSRSRGISKLFFKLIFRIIYFFSSHQRQSRFKYISNPKRSAFIFQNQADIDFINKEICKMNKSNFYLIPGSGVPKSYISQSDIYKKNSYWLHEKKPVRNIHDLQKNITFIYCARLLKTKGILIFLELSKLYPNNKFLIFGSLDSSAKDSLTTKEIENYKKYYNNVIFMQKISNPLLQKNIHCPILIIPSFYGEGFPRGVIEANTLSIPVIGSKEVANKISINNLLYISEENKPICYSRCIKEILEDYKNSKLESRLKDARTKAIKNFSEELIVEMTLNVYQSFESYKNNSYLLNKDRKKFNDWLAQ